MLPLPGVCSASVNSPLMARTGGGGGACDLLGKGGVGAARLHGPVGCLPHQLPFPLLTRKDDFFRTTGTFLPVITYVKNNIG
jgi:hypothetical protein